jgi:hypothetical protein
VFVLQHHRQINQQRNVLTSSANAASGDAAATTATVLAAAVRRKPALSDDCKLMRVADIALARGNAVLGINACAHDATARAATAMVARMCFLLLKF